MTERNITYNELLEEDLNRRLLGEIEALLPQLSDNVEPVTRERLTRMLRGGTRMFGAFDGERLVGSALLVLMHILVGTKAWVEDVVVDEEYRGAGIGSGLMWEVEVAAREEGATSINLTSKPERVEAHRLYKRLGYAQRTTVVFRKTF